MPSKIQWATTSMRHPRGVRWEDWVWNNIVEFSMAYCFWLAVLWTNCILIDWIAIGCIFLRHGVKTNKLSKALTNRGLSDWIAFSKLLRQFWRRFNRCEDERRERLPYLITTNWNVNGCLTLICDLTPLSSQEIDQKKLYNPNEYLSSQHELKVIVSFACSLR